MTNLDFSSLHIAYSLYELFPKTPLGSVAALAPRKGSLLKIQFKDGKVGYADCFPWPELGDLPLTSQLDLLKKGHLTNLTRRSLFFAQMDSEARAAHTSLWNFGDKGDMGKRENRESHIGGIPPSHALLAHLKLLTPVLLESLASQGFTSIKLKLGSSNFREGARVLAQLGSLLRQYSLKVRLDFNSALTGDDVEIFFQELGQGLDPGLNQKLNQKLKLAREQIDFIEDPTPYDSRLWSEIQKKWGVRLALDRMSEEIQSHLVPGSFSLVVLKPAIQDPKWMTALAEKFGVNLVVTSYLDHPFGQYCAAWTAVQLCRLGKEKGRVKVEACGLLSHFSYEPQGVSDWIDSQGPDLKIPQGVGLGMDQNLAHQIWKPL